jgi:hypothetical protein
MTYEQACKLIGCRSGDLERAKSLAAFTLRTVTPSCPLRIKVAAKLILEKAA